MQGGRVCITKRSPKGRGGREQIPALLPEPCSVDAAAIWNEGYRNPYLGRSGRYAQGKEPRATHTAMYD